MSKMQLRKVDVVQLRKIDVGVLLGTLVIALAMVLVLVTPAHTQETKLAAESVEAEQTLTDEDTSQSEQSAPPSTTQATTLQTTTPSDAEDTAQQTPTPPTAESTTQQNVAEQQGGCRVVDTFTGSGETRTDTPLFTIVGPQWRVVYQTVNTAPPSVGRGGILGFFIKNERGDPLDPNGVEVRGDNSGIKNVNSDPGRYYIQIISAEVEWTIRVEDCGSQSDDSNNPSPGPFDDGSDQVMDNTNSSKKLPNTGGIAILAPAVVLLLSGAGTGLLAMRRR
jgi:hypothetical protein